MTGLQCLPCLLPHKDQVLLVLASLHVTVGLVHVPGRWGRISQSRHQAGDRAVAVDTKWALSVLPTFLKEPTGAEVI